MPVITGNESSKEGKGFFIVELRRRGHGGHLRSPRHASQNGRRHGTRTGKGTGKVTSRLALFLWMVVNSIIIVTIIIDIFFKRYTQNNRIMESIWIGNENIGSIRVLGR